MTRRDAIKTAATLLLPTWKFKPVATDPVVIPFHEFVDKGTSYYRRYEMAEPFVQPDLQDNLFTFATDGRILLRVDARDEHRGDDDKRRPPAGKLGFFDHDSLTNWKPWPKSKPIIEDDSPCPLCDGWGTANGLPPPECPKCDGCGCKKCNHDGHVKSGFPVCSMCNGKGNGRFAKKQNVGNGLYVAANYDRRIRLLNHVEYSIPDRHDRPVRFRFDGGIGIVMALK